MTYNVGNIVVAADYNGFRGPNGPATAYANATVATNCVAALIGVGYGNRGYGQTSTVFNAVVAGESVTASAWNVLRGIMSNINIHQGNTVTIQNTVVAGETIQAMNGSGGRANISALISSLDTNRLSFSAGQMALSSKLASNTAADWNTTVYHEFTVTFASEDDARYFFNTGSQVYLAGGITGGNGTVIDNTLSTLLTDMGTVKFSSNATTYTGTGGTGSSIGYYNLSSSYQTLFVANSSAASYVVTAKAESIVGNNGANGSTIRFRANVNTGSSSYVTVNATTHSNISQLISSGTVSVTAPTYTTTHAIS